MVDTVIVKESNFNLYIGNVTFVEYGKQPTVTSRRDGDKLYLDFVMPISKGGVVVDGAMSDTSTNPVQNGVIKAYVDGGRGKFDRLVFDEEGLESYTSSNCFKNYDLLFCRANTDGVGVPMDISVIRKVIDEKGSTSVQLDDGRSCSVFTFHNSGFYVTDYSAESSGRIYAVYGVKL